MSIFISLLRPKEWLKNIFIFSPLVFSGKLIYSVDMLNTIVTVFYFCITASLVYIINDIRDVHHDRLHPIKSKRAIASGKITMAMASSIAVVLLLFVATSYYFMPKLTIVLIAYLLLNILYSLYLKRLPIIELFIVATGYVLRIYAGALVINSALSDWMLVTAFSLTLYIVCIKRLQELRNYGSTARHVLQYYDLASLQFYATIAATSSIVFYSLFILLSQHQHVVLIPLVIYGLFRYWHSAKEYKRESPIDIIINDSVLQLTVTLWIISSTALIYYSP